MQSDNHPRERSTDRRRPVPGSSSSPHPPNPSNPSINTTPATPSSGTATAAASAGGAGAHVQTRTGRPVRVAHRRSPSELTPLVQEKLALQQQIEMLQAQQQQMLAQQQYGMMPVYHSMPPPGMVPAYPYYAPAPAPQPHAPHHAPQHSQQLSPHHAHQRKQSGHVRRHSLAVSEARRAAHEEQQRRDPVTAPPSASSGVPLAQPTPQSSQKSQSPAPAGGALPSRHAPAASVGSPGPIAGPNVPSLAAAGDFKFPPSPSRGAHRRSPSNSSPVRGQFQFPPGGHARQQSQGGAGHQHRRSNSRNLDSNWRQPASFDAGGPGAGDFLQPPQFVPGHRARGSFNSSVSSIAAFTEGSSAGSMSGRKSLFVPYLSQASIPQLLADGLLVAGTLRVNRKNRSDAYVATDVLDADIFICGSKDRNRALEGDIVAVELLDVNDVWDSKKEKEEKKRRRDATDDARLVETANGELRRKGSLKQRPTQKRNDDVEVEGQTLLLKEEEQVSDEIRPLYAGHVVAILERPAGQLFSGTLGLLRPSSQATKERQQAERAEKGEPALVETRTDRPKIVWFKPTDKCVPLMAIPTEQAPADFVENHAAYADKIFVAAIKRWPITSLHPFGTLIEELGRDDTAVVTAVLRDNNFGAHRFSDAAAAVAEQAEAAAASATTSEPSEPSEPATSAASTDTVSTAGLETPLSGSALAESLSSLAEDRPLYSGSAIQNQEFAEIAVTLKDLTLSVHVLDLVPFIREGSALDRELRHKGVGVYMRQTTSPLLPLEYGQKLSFAAGKATPALTVEFDLFDNFDVRDVRVLASVVKPSQLLPLDALPTLDGYDKLARIAEAFRDHRGGVGLSLDSMLDVRVPCGPSLFEAEPAGPGPERETTPSSDSGFLKLPPQGINAPDVVAELARKVNATVARQLLDSNPQQAFLYQQGPPVPAKLEALTAALKGSAVALDTTSARTLNASLLAVTDLPTRHALEVALYKCLAPQKYGVAGRGDPHTPGHYWLNVPAYTHFTGPLRRYADHVVHRQVHALLADARPPAEEEARLAALASELSFRTDCARNVQDQSIHLETSERLGELAKRSGYVLFEGIVVQVYESAFDVVIPELGIEKRVHGDQLPLVKAEFHKDRHVLELYWDPSQDAATYAPAENSSTPDALSTAAIAAASSVALDAFTLVTRAADDGHVQEIRMLARVPVLVRADLGVRTLPSITVRTVNPFFKAP